MGGVSANVEPAFNVKVRLALPEPLLTVRLMAYVFAAGVVPEIVPDVASIASPVGSPVASNLSGACPVADTVYRSGLPVTAPTRPPPRIRGVAGAAAVEMVMSVCAAKAGDANAAENTAIGATQASAQDDTVRFS